MTLAHETKRGLVSDYLKSDISDEFSAIYAQNGFINHDPFLLFSCHSLTAKKFGVADISSFPSVSKQQQLFLDCTAEFGASNGIGVPVRIRGDRQFGGWVFSSCEPAETFEKLQRDHGREMHLAGIMAFERQLSLNFAGTNQQPILSSRERECLQWLSVGLRVSMIADRLSISESAVNLYISNARKKLGAKTREQALVRAIIRGEVVL
ncbi:MAG: LuxR C-terminal-related transcriptional regulator [Hyphomicrobiales bacterium]